MVPVYFVTVPARCSRRSRPAVRVRVYRVTVRVGVRVGVRVRVRVYRVAVGAGVRVTVTVRLGLDGALVLRQSAC